LGSTWRNQSQDREAATQVGTHAQAHTVQTAAIGAAQSKNQPSPKKTSHAFVAFRRICRGAVFENVLVHSAVRYPVAVRSDRV